MKIIRKDIPSMTIEEFADANKLTMLVQERELPEGNPARYWAHFEHAEVLDGRIAWRMSGDGATSEEAIANYAGEISCKLLVLYAGSAERREILAPRLKVKPKKVRKAKVRKPAEPPQEVYTLGIGCRPGPIRPGSLLPLVLRDTGVCLDKVLSSRSFGDWEWIIPIEQHELYRKARPTIMGRLDCLYKAGKIRWATW